MRLNIQEITPTIVKKLGNIGLLAMVFSGIIVCAYAQKPSENSSEPLKLSIIMSGGGAKGFAHIGVLEIIDSLGINAQIVGGTSMGGIVGALYSIGYKPSQIYKIAKNVDWPAILSDEIPRSIIPMEEKTDLGKTILTFPLEGFRKLKIPSGLVEGQQVSLLLSELTAGIHHVSDFNKFNKEYFCIAADIVNGKAIVIDSGFLPTALRATMSIPTALTPIERNGTLLVDGGLLNNFPVVEARERGADFIIGIDVQSGLYQKDELNSLPRILEQTTSFVRAQNNDIQRANCDIYIHPNISGFGVTSFEALDSLYYRGRQAALNALPELKYLKKLLEQQNKKQTHKAKAPQITLFDSAYITKIEVKGLKQIPESYVLPRTKLQIPGRYSIKEIKQAANLLYASQFFKQVNFKILPHHNGEATLQFLAEEQENNFLRLGIHYDDDFRAAILVSATFRNILFRASKWNTEIRIGQSPRITTNYFIGRGKLPGIGIEAQSQRFDVPIYENHRQVSSFNYNSFRVGTYTQWSIGNFLSVGGGARFEITTLANDIGLIPIDNINYRYLLVNSFLRTDSYDRVMFPHRGSLADVHLNLLQSLSQPDFTELNKTPLVLYARYNHAIPINKKLTIIPKAFGGFSLGDSIPVPYQFYLGGLGNNYIYGIMPFVGFNFMESGARNSAVGRIDTQYEWMKNHFFTLKLNAATLNNNLVEMINTPSDIFYGAGLSYGFSSVLGPLEVTLMSNSITQRFDVYINMGFWF